MQERMGWIFKEKRDAKTFKNNCLNPKHIQGRGINVDFLYGEDIIDIFSFLWQCAVQ